MDRSVADSFKTYAAPVRCDARMQIEFVSGVAMITPDPPESRKLYVDALGLPLEHKADEYWASEKIPGSKHFGVWPLAEAAQACFGTPTWPDDRPVPQVSVEFEVQDADAVAAGAKELEDRGHTLVHGAREEPWGQTVARLISLEGAIIGLSYAPWLHE
jgi:catechol 2,3-dioxygenase-like lactoylglutathione lyase family enzyme